MLRHAGTEMTAHAAKEFLQFLRNRKPGAPRRAARRGTGMGQEAEGAADCVDT